MLNRVADGKGNFGYNAATGEYGDMVELGILDPTKVTRTALQNAASIAGLMITTEAMVAEAPKKEEATTTAVVAAAWAAWAAAWISDRARDPLQQAGRKSPASRGAFSFSPARIRRARVRGIRVRPVA